MVAVFLVVALFLVLLMLLFQPRLQMPIFQVVVSVPDMITGIFSLVAFVEEHDPITEFHLFCGALGSSSILVQFRG